MTSKQTPIRRGTRSGQKPAPTSPPTPSGTRLDERVAALERLVGEQAAVLARQHELIARQSDRLAALDARAPAPSMPSPVEPAATSDCGAPERPSRRAMLKFGGMAAAAGAAALAGAATTELARPGVAHAAGTAWLTGTVSADELTHVVPNGTFGNNVANTAVLDVTVNANSGASPAHPLPSANSAAIAAYDVTVGGAIGLYGDSINGKGVFGRGLFGVVGSSSSGTGVSGASDTSFAVEGNSASGVGGHFMGGKAPLLLVPAGTAGAPASGTHTKGEIYLDLNASVWVCVAGGSPGTWLKPGVNLLPSPIRIFDTRSNFGQGVPLPVNKGALAGGSTTTIQVTGTTVGNISVPAGATAVIGNLTAANTQGGGDLILYPTGVSQPNTSNINYVAGETIANFAIVGLSAAGQMNLFVHVNGTDAIFDVAGYIL